MPLDVRLDLCSLSSIPYKIDVIEWVNVDPAFQKIIQSTSCQIN